MRPCNGPSMRRPSWMMGFQIPQPIYDIPDLPRAGFTALYEHELWVKYVLCPTCWFPMSFGRAGYYEEDIKFTELVSQFPGLLKWETSLGRISGRIPGGQHGFSRFVRWLVACDLFLASPQGIQAWQFIRSLEMMIGKTICLLTIWNFIEFYCP